MGLFCCCCFRRRGRRGWLSSKVTPTPILPLIKNQAYVLVHLCDSVDRNGLMAD